MKKLISISIVFVLLFAMATSAFASVSAVPYSTELSFANGNANCSCSYYQSGQRITMMMSLYKNGSLVDSWFVSGNSSIALNETYPTVSGATYKLTFSCTVNGNAVSIPAITKVCP